MRAIMGWAAAGVCGLATVGYGQTPSTYPLAAPAAMPGTQIGKPILQPVGNPISKAVPQAGQRVGSGPGGLPPSLDPQLPRPAGQQIDLKNVIAPYPQQPTPDKSFWTKLEDRWFALFQSPTPAVRPNNWTPGIARRNRERAEERRERQWWQN